ncbi:MAG: UDP-N-acetylglucosamine 2-epimerase (non-hydrolyzing) [Pyrinomonadaceae bacterium]
MTVFGTRPEIIRLSLIMKKLDGLCDHVTVHTGQNYDKGLSDIFLDQLGVREPNEHMGVREGGFGAQIGKILATFESLVQKHVPDRLLLLGDTNSALTAIIAARMGIPVFHMEAGNRCFDDRVPEEVNRRIIDHSSTILMPYTSRSRDNLVDEGIPRERIFVTGNPILEVINGFGDAIDGAASLEDNAVRSGEYFLVTLHRSENVDTEERLRGILKGLSGVAAHYQMPVLVSVHPRTASKMAAFGIEKDSELLKFLSPLGFFDFVKLEKNAFAVMTDSGTVQEECAIFGIPNVTLRDVTERPETLECGSNILSGGDPASILDSVKIAVSSRGTWSAPAEYLAENVSETVVKIVLGHTSIRKHWS